MVDPGILVPRKLLTSGKLLLFRSENQILAKITTILSQKGNACKNYHHFLLNLKPLYLSQILTECALVFANIHIF